MSLATSKKVIFSVLAIFIVVVGSVFFIKNQSSSKISDKAPLDKIKIAHPTNLTVLTAIIGAQEGGFFEKYNIDVELIETARTSDALTTGSSDVAVSTGMFAILGAAAKGHDLVWVANLTNNFPNFLVSRVPKERIQKMGTTSVGSANYYNVLVALRMFNLDPEKVTIIPLVDDKGMTAALDRGDVDALTRSGPVWEAYKAAHPDNNLFVYDISSGSALLNALSLLATGEVARNRPEVLSNLTAALLEGTVYAKEHPKEIEARMVKDYQLEPGVAAGMIEGYMKAAKNLTVVPDVLTGKTAAELMEKDVPEVKGYDLGKYINTKIAEDALKKVDLNQINQELAK